ncbi:class I lanthipeptide [Chryseobacterium lactis]|nr:class I lanthipeptide [Chryseobacterium lactis]
MKKLKLNKGLQINKEAISKLQDEQIKSIKGGAAAFSCVGGSCNNNTKEATKLQDPS